TSASAAGRSPNRCGRRLSGVTASRCVSFSNSARPAINRTMACRSRGCAARTTNGIAAVMSPILPRSPGRPTTGSAPRPPARAPGQPTRTATNCRIADRRAVAARLHWPHPNRPPVMTPDPYLPRRHARSRFVEARGLRHHVLEWGDATTTSEDRPTLVMLHGLMDVAASFQFVVDAFAADRHVVALDWRGFGQSETPQADTYFFAEYLGDLETVLDALFGADRGPLDLLGHSKGGNVAML